MLIIAMLFVTIITEAAKPLYQIGYPKPGMYIEQLREAKITKRTFQIEVKFEKVCLKEDANTIQETVKQMEKFCKNATKILEKTHCSALTHSYTFQRKKRNK